MYCMKKSYDAILNVAVFFSMIYEVVVNYRHRYKYNYY